MLIEANNEFFTTSNCQNINIHPRKKQIDTTCTKEEKVKRYICLTFAPSLLSVTVRGFKQWYHCQRERQRGWTTGRLSDREKINRVRERKGRQSVLNWLQSVTVFTLNISWAVYLLLFTQRIRLYRSTSDTFFLYLKVSLWDSSKAQNSMFA